MNQRMVDAKTPVTSLAGAYGHPLHPAIVALPIGAWISSVVLDIASRFIDDAPTASHAAWWLLGLGILGALAAASVGFLDLLAIAPGTKARKIGLTHMTVNLIATALFVLAWLLRRDDVAPSDGTSTGLLVLSIVALLLLATGGYLGGELAYHYGVRVADEATQAAGYEVAATDAPAADQDGGGPEAGPQPGAPAPPSAPR